MPEISGLEAAGAIWGWVSIISLALASLGAVVEFITIWTSWIKTAWKSKIERTSALVVLLGSVVGLVAAWKLSGINGQIIAILNKAAANAVERLEEAKERTAKVEKEVANAYQAARRAEAEARKFEAEISTSKARAEEAKQIAERERLERVKLEAQVAPRRLSLDQQRLITAALRRFSGRQTILSSYGLDGEAAALGEQIISILRSAGIVVTDRRAHSISTGGFELGIQIRGPNTEREFMSGITHALSSIGKLQQVVINGSSFRPGVTLGGSAAMGGTAGIGGGGGMVMPDIPTTGPVSITIGVKPLSVLIGK